MTEEQLNKLIHANEQLGAFVYDWFKNGNDEIRSMFCVMIEEQKKLHQHLGNSFQTMILIMAQMKLSEMWQQLAQRSKEEI